MKAGAAVLATAALLLAGCTAAPPPGPTDAELDAYHVALLDEVWSNTALEGVVERPAIAVVDTLDPSNWVKQVYICLEQRGVGGFSLLFGEQTGLSLISLDASVPPSEADQLAFYVCTAQYRLNGSDILGSQPLRSRAQLDYIYDYFSTWLVPCMLENGYAVPYAPSREDFVASQGRWNPSWSVRDVEGGQVMDELVQLCGPELPPLE